MHGGRWYIALVKFMEVGYDLFWMVVGLSRTGTWTKSLNETAASSTTCTLPKGTDNYAAEERHAYGGPWDGGEVGTQLPAKGHAVDGPQDGSEEGAPLPVENAVEDDGLAALYPTLPSSSPRLCPLHQQLLELYCCDEKKDICEECSLHEHKGHQVVRAGEDRERVQQELNAKIQKSIADRERIIQSLLQVSQTHKARSVLQYSLQSTIQKLMMDSQTFFTDVLKSIELSCSQSIVAMDSSAQADSGTMKIWNPEPVISGVRSALDVYRQRLDDLTKTSLASIFRVVRIEPKLDPNSAYRQIRLSDASRKATLCAENQNYPEKPERFMFWRQVMCVEPLAGSPYYWEVEWTGQRVTVGVAYGDMARSAADDSARLGHNTQSWSLYWSGKAFFMWHAGKETALTGPKARRIGVYVDQQEGLLAFYRVSHNQAQEICCVHTHFEGPLFPSFRFWSGVGSAITICELE
ncbi:E3 ubiquitin-protein ligase RNF135 [Triplophysa tibetana]|uniref:E3 ubiquitin-protein ligase RNF135 n=1 Tax=Triplophysa tibetana TaxID=1572043 RepID=A0A5A9N0A6_9TELE|nr:E3 ubiquitin-protein ligase RNF135 [Triplophysa tibetana]